MRFKPLWMSCALAGAASLAAVAQLAGHENESRDLGLIIQQHLRAESWELFGVRDPLVRSGRHDLLRR